MALETLKFGNLEGGRALAAANEELLRIIGDVVERKYLPDERSVTLTITVKPKLEGAQNIPILGWKVTWKMPGRSGMETRAIEVDGELQVNPNEFTNPLQCALCDVPGFDNKGD